MHQQKVGSANPLILSLGKPMRLIILDKGRGWKFWADSNLKGKFWGRSIQLDPVGVLTLQFDDDETFQWSKVTTSIYNIILGKIYCDHYGTMRIKGSGNYSCKLKFKEQSIIDRNPHQVHGFVQDNRTGEKVAMLVGKWDEAMYYVLGDPTNKAKKGLLEKLPPTDSRLRPDQRHLENGEYELANAEKLRLEHLQRQHLSCGRPDVSLVSFINVGLGMNAKLGFGKKVAGKGWQPRWFRKDKEDGCYRYIGGYWETREKGTGMGIPNILARVVIHPHV
ncbi:Oxysterol-binding protein-related protein 1D [Vitis vinifera]|uniref:Oxysterol-binding protein-related protein 1D n=1 Tax=Vitis vinifera TaxID=29760 RepID=A0A438J5R5_VITVI|nr:Oxysterol-binding protein-related protein 1D [Vitis vinifera]